MKSALEAANKKLETSTTAQSQRETTKWSTIVKKSPRKNSRRGPLLLTTNTSREFERSEAENSGASAASRLHRHPKRERVVVPGMRRVWETLKHTPAGAVVVTLKKLTTIGEQLAVKRVFRSGTANSRDRWWFHLLGSEDLAT